MMKIIKFIKQGIYYIPRFIKGRILEPQKKISGLKSGEGGIIKENNKTYAVYKDENGEIIKLSAVCTHMKCIVAWDQDNKSWACPCHGSKFDRYGKVIKGPAKKDLKIIKNK